MNDTCSARRVNLITVHAYVFYSLYVVNGSLFMNLTGESSVIRAINAQGGVYMFGRMLPIWAVILIEFCFAYALENLLGSPLSFKLACRVFNPQKNHPMIFETAIICATVGIMCPAMSFLAAWFYYPYYAGFNIKLYPDSKDPVRIALCVNQRNALHTPLAHQSLVGGIMLEYKDKMRDWSLERQSTAYRGMVFVQSQEENVLMGVASQAGITRMILSKESDPERQGAAGYINSLASRVITATVSYVGKANYKEAEQYIRDFRVWTSSAANGLTVEISAVNGRFTLDFLQTFSSSVFVNAFLNELEDNGIVYDLQDVNKLELPNIKLPWTE